MSVERGSRTLGYVLIVVAVACLARATLLGPRPLLRLGGVLVSAVMLAIGVAYVRAAGRLTPTPDAADHVTPARDAAERRSPTVAERRLLAQHAVTSVLAEAPTFEDAMPRILAAVCTQLDWEWGAFWVVDAQADVLRFVGRWSRPGVAVARFELASRERTFARGVGLPGRVWERGAPAWVADVVGDLNFPRAPIAAQEDLHGAFAFPVAAGGTVLAVVEFFTHAVREPDESLLATFVTLGRQIGLFVERTRAEERLRASERDLRESLEREHAARDEAEAASRAKDEFLATISHELRAPLTPILLWTRMLQARSLDETTTTRALRAIETNAHAQAQLVEDLLDVSRIVTGKLRLDVDAVVLSEVVERALESVRPAADAKGVALAVVLDGAPAVVGGDPGRLQQVVWNLLSNAVKFTARGGHVEVRLAARERDVELTVRDDGTGISPEFLPRVFERFRQADGGSTRAQGGLGLGLAIVKYLVELHGGQVSAESGGENRGATFTVRLPRRPVASAPRGTASGADAPVLARERLRDRRVLVVDDDEDTRHALRAVLARAGAEVRLADSAAAAMDALHGWRPDALVSDLGLPGEDGFALLRRIRALPAADGGEVPAVALTGYARAEDRIRGIEAGFQRHVVKPVDPVELVDVVATLAAGATPVAAACGEGAPATPAAKSAPTEPACDETPPAAVAARGETSSAGAAPAESGLLANVAATDVLAFVSHELRQPLAAMRIWLNLLEDEMGESLSAEARDHVEQIRASVNWMAELISGRLATELDSRIGKS